MPSPDKLCSVLVIAALLASAPALGQTPCSGANSLSCTEWANIDASMARLVHQGYMLADVRAVAGSPAQDLTTTYYLFHAGDLVRCTEIFTTALGGEAALGCQRLVEPYKVR
jgi:hypothetical protein